METFKFVLFSLQIIWWILFTFAIVLVVIWQITTTKQNSFHTYFCSSTIHLAIKHSRRSLYWTLQCGQHEQTTVQKWILTHRAHRAHQLCNKCLNGIIPCRYIHMQLRLSKRKCSVYLVTFEMSNKTRSHRWYHSLILGS